MSYRFLAQLDKEEVDITELVKYEYHVGTFIVPIADHDEIALARKLDRQNGSIAIRQLQGEKLLSSGL